MKVLSSLISKGFTVTESAPGTWTTKEISIPSAARESIGISIVGIDFEMKTPADIPAAGTPEVFNNYILEEEKVTEPDADDPDIIGKQRVVVFGDGVNVQAVLPSNLGWSGRLILVPEHGFYTIRQTVHVGIKTTNAAAAGVSVGNLKFFIVKFTPAELIDLGFRESFD